MINLDIQLAHINEALSQVGKHMGYRMCVNVALVIANKSIPKAPVDTGHLRNSCVILANQGTGFESKTTRTQLKFNNIRKNDLAQQTAALEQIKAFLARANDPTAVVSFTAYYAVIVHEGNPGKNWHAGGPKFLERGVNETVNILPALIPSLVKADHTRARTIDGAAKAARDAGTKKDRP